MPVEIRKAVSADCDAIAEIMRSAWPDEAVYLSLIQAALHDPNHETLVAVLEGNTVGFVDGFLTVSGQRGPRWEVDLLAVRDRWRMDGVGTALIAAVLKVGVVRGAVLARALVDVRNEPGEKAFRRSGFLPVDQLLLLFVSTLRADIVPEATASAGWIWVRTFRYRGIWLEPPVWTQRALLSARSAVGVDDLTLVGALIPADDDVVCKTALHVGYSLVGSYRWWVRPLGS